MPIDDEDPFERLSWSENAESPLLPPDDRIWRHPSEVRAAALPVETVEPVEDAERHRGTGTALLAGALSTIVVVALLTLTGVLDGLNGSDGTETVASATSLVGTLTASTVMAQGGGAEVTGVAWVSLDNQAAPVPALVYDGAGTLVVLSEALGSGRPVAARCGANTTDSVRLVGLDPSREVAVLTSAARGCGQPNLSTVRPHAGDPVQLMAVIDDGDSMAPTIVRAQADQPDGAPTGQSVLRLSSAPGAGDNPGVAMCGERVIGLVGDLDGRLDDGVTSSLGVSEVFRKARLAMDSRSSANSTTTEAELVDGSTGIADALTQPPGG